MADPASVFSKKNPVAPCAGPIINLTKEQLPMSTTSPFLLDRQTGIVRFGGGDNAGQEEGLIIVTGSPPAAPDQVIAALNAGAAVPLPLSQTPPVKYTIAWGALQNAINAQTRIALTAVPLTA
jgi:hypothetical protein